MAQLSLRPPLLLAPILISAAAHANACPVINGQYAACKMSYLGEPQPSSILKSVEMKTSVNGAGVTVYDAVTVTEDDEANPATLITDNVPRDESYEDPDLGPVKMTSVARCEGGKLVNDEDQQGSNFQIKTRTVIAPNAQGELQLDILLNREAPDMVLTITCSAGQ